MVLKNLPVVDILRTCSTSNTLKPICDEHNNNLWGALVERDFGDQVLGKYDAATNPWKEIYKNSYTRSGTRCQSTLLIHFVQIFFK